MTGIIDPDSRVLEHYAKLSPQPPTYPEVIALQGDFGDRQYRQHIERGNDELIPRPISLSVHVPELEGRTESYVEQLLREIELVAPLFDRDRDVIRVQWAGWPDQLGRTLSDRILDSINRHFHLAGTAVFGCRFDMDAAALDAGRLGAFGAADPHSVHVELKFGRTAMSPRDFAQAMQAVITAHPDSIDLVDGALIGCVAEVGTALDVAARLAMLEAAVGYLNEAGYKHVFKGRFDLGTSGTQELACDRIGLGSGAISHTGDGVALSASGTREWQADLDARRLPVSCGKSLTREDRERADLLRRLLRGKKVRADRLANCPAVGRHALEKLRDLEECDLLRAAEDRVTATSRGRYLWRILARCLDPDPQLGGHIVSHDGHNSEERSRGDPAPERRRG